MIKYIRDNVGWNGLILKGGCMDEYLNSLQYVLQKTEIRLKKLDFVLNYEDGMDKLVNIFYEKKKDNKSIAFIGNGGSAAIAIHMTSDFLKNGKMKTLSLYNPATLTCLGNDYGYEEVFSKQVENIMRSGDMLIAISSSGRSPNIIKAVDAAHDKDVVVMSFTGFDDSNTVRLNSDISIYLPSHKYGIVESIHNLMLQEIVDRLMDLENK